MAVYSQHVTVNQSLLQQQTPCDFSNTPSHPKTLTPTPILLDVTSLIHPSEPPVTDKLFSGFLEHLGRCIYGGIVDNPDDPSPKDLLEVQDEGKTFQKGRLGWRKDVMGCLAKDGELEIPMLRWPGGNFVSNYHWQDGIGSISERPKRIELAWLSDESNKFGTDEFIDYCRVTAAEPYICLNMGTGSLEEALAWVEYCNGTGDTHWANLRRKNTGKDEPHAVKYWGLGNEMWGPWQVGNLLPSEYVRKARQWAHALKLVDPSMVLVSCGETGASDWDREVIQGLLPWADMHSIHFYTMLGHDKMSSVSGYDYEKNVFGPAAAEKHIDICKSLIDLANIGRTWERMPTKDMKICFDEWNVWDDVKAPGSNGLEQWYDYTDMLGFCAWLNVLVRKHKDIGIACLAQSVNVISPLMTKPDGIVRQTLYYPLQLFSKYMKNGHLLQLPVFPDVYTGPTFPVYIQQGNYKPSYVDSVAILVETEKGASIRVSVLNRHPEVDWSSKIGFSGFEVESIEVHEIYSDDLAAVNTFENSDTIIPKITKKNAKEWDGDVLVKKHSWSFFIFNGRFR
ncbi:alpha-N-arabinofuranosidase [Cryptococcus neoformans]|nr:alpha-N-arabinofuranosidase [Cryptococcus neoformans var. grubii Th84]OXH00364.1 alpha-N-arabinofuranosidase [Cryptococcus neoformans var. grubii]OXH21724.1 alpha-N-arabinofuranosidase [Cryptococcus neoformans var. grubii]OXH41545.1 alpha-N-arabinofuranosidase [Cryptococcus neoformans var. grubii]OXH42488.1 alpha-N-arabinofuranosidase [Cryptococcus neoformans var. grubii]